MAEVVGNIEVVATINSKGYDAGKKAIEKGNAELEGGADKTSKGFSSAWTGAIAGVALALTNKFIGAVTSSIDGAIKRVDTLSNAKRTFENMGISAVDSGEAMKALQKSIKGLPTPLDGAVRGMTALTATYGDVRKGEKVFSALNNAILGFGGSSAMVDNAITQLSQLPMDGPLDAQTWNSLRNSGITPVLAAMAKDSGMSVSQMKEAFGKGELTVQDFTDRLVKMNKDGGGGLKSLEKIAKDSTKGIGTGIVNMKTAITKGVAAIIESVGSSKISGAISGIGDAFEGVLKSIAGIVKFISGNSFLSSFFVNLAGVIIGASVAMGVLNAVMAINPIVLVATAVAGLIAGIVTLGQKLGWWKALWDGITKAFDELKKALQPVIDAFITYLWPIIQKIGAFVGGVFKQAWNNITKAFNELRIALEPIMPLLKVIGTVIMVAMVAPLLALVATIGIVVSAIVGIVTAIAWVYGQVAGFVAKIVGVFNGMRASVSNINWGQVGKDIIAGIGKGISSMGKWLAQKAVEAVNGAKNAIKNFFGIKSPSRVMRDEVGKMIGEGLAIGISSTSNIVTKSSIGLADDVMAGWDSPKAYASSGAFEYVSSNEQAGTTINQTNNVYSELDMAIVNRNLTWELNRA